jgi:hypothetical protein
VWPIPFFGERIRQPDIREYAQIALLMLSEMMQHSENELTTYITDSFASRIGLYMREILALMATKYFGYSRTAAYASDFKLQDADFAAYDPSKVMTSVEMTEERPPLLWWPTENDLSAIRGIPISEALVLAKRWPATALLTQADGHVLVTPSSGADGVPGTTPTGSVAFTEPPGQAP